MDVTVKSAACPERCGKTEEEMSRFPLYKSDIIFPLSVKHPTDIMWLSYVWLWPAVSALVGCRQCSAQAARPTASLTQWFGRWGFRFSLGRGSAGCLLKRASTSSVWDTSRMETGTSNTPQQRKSEQISMNQRNAGQILDSDSPFTTEKMELLSWSYRFLFICLGCSKLRCSVIHGSILTNEFFSVSLGWFTDSPGMNLQNLYEDIDILFRSQHMCRIIAPDHMGASCRISARMNNTILDKKYMPHSLTQCLQEQKINPASGVSLHFLIQ